MGLNDININYKSTKTHVKRDLGGEALSRRDLVVSIK